MFRGMRIGEREIGQRMKRFERVCRDAGVKLTHQRMEIFREVAQTGDHPDAETIYRRVRRRIPAISLDTVYRTLHLLEDTGVISRVGMQGDRTRFDANVGRHHHFVCGQCGAVQDCAGPSAGALRPSGDVRSMGTVHSVHVEFRGVCRGCEAKA